MKISKFLKQQFLFICATLFLTAAFFVSKKISRPIVFISKQESTLNLNNKLTQYFHTGYKRLISSAMWIATILESDLDHYKNKDLNSWMFLRFKTISELEPRFYENYRYGGIYLSIVKDDLPGASYIYNLGLKQYPDDYFLLKNAAFHFEFEVGDQKRSYEIYQRLRSHPQTDFLTLSVLARLENQMGKREAAFALLMSQYEKIQDKNSFLAQVMFKHLYAIKAEIDLDCLNNKNQNCSNVDLENNFYVKKGKLFFAQKEWEPYRIKHKSK